MEKYCFKNRNPLFFFRYSWHRLREQQQQEKEAKQQADEAKKNKKKTKRKNIVHFSKSGPL